MGKPWEVVNMKKVLVALLITLYVSMPLWMFEKETILVCDIETKQLCEYNVQTDEFDCFQELGK